MTIYIQVETGENDFAPLAVRCEIEGDLIRKISQLPDLMKSNDLCSVGINPVSKTGTVQLTAVGAMDDSMVSHTPLEVVVSDDGLEFVVELEMTEPTYGTVFKTLPFTVEDLEAAITNSEDVFLGFQEESLIDEIKASQESEVEQGPSF